MLLRPADADGFFAQADGAVFAEGFAGEDLADELFAVDGDGVFQQLAGGFAGGGREAGELQHLGDAEMGWAAAIDWR